MTGGFSASCDYWRDNGTRRWWWRSLMLAVGLGLFLLYVGSYYHLSRRGMQEAKVFNMRGFLYVPLTEVLATQDLSRHHARAELYAPLNWVDRELLGSEGPVCCILFGLSKEPRNAADEAGHD